jgi:hypothetical protein
VLGLIAIALIFSQELTTEKIDLLVNRTRDERPYACPKSFYLFAVYGKVREAAHFRLWHKV